MSVERELYRLRDKEYPERPQTHEDIKVTLNDPKIFEDYGKTLNKQKPFYISSVVNKKYAFHMFASYAVMDLIKTHIPPKDRNYLMDGTFKIIPRGLNQLLIISIEYKNDVSLSLFHYCYYVISSVT